MSSEDISDNEYIYDTSDEEETPKKRIYSSLLSNPVNQISSSSGEDHLETTSSSLKSSNNKKLDCPHGQKDSIHSEGDYNEQSDDQQDDSTDEYPDVGFTAPVVTTNKVVPFTALRKDVEMGQLVPAETTTTTTKTAQLKTKTSNFSFTFFDSMNAQELDELRASEEKRLAQLQTPLFTPPLPSTTTTSTPSVPSFFKPPSELNPYELDEVAQNREKYKASLKMAYKPQHVSNLSSQKRDELFIQQRKEFMKHVKPLETLSQDQLDALKPFACPLHPDSLHTTDVNDLTVDEMRQLILECRAKHTQPKVLMIDDGDKQLFDPLRSSRFAHIMPEDTRKIAVTRTKVNFTKKPDIVLKGSIKNSSSTSLPKKSYSNSSNPLVDFNTLPREKQQEIRQKMALNAAAVTNKKTFENPKSSVSKQREFGLANNALLSTASIKGLYHNLGTQKISCPMTNLSTVEKEVDLMQHLKKTHPVYAELLRENISRRLLQGLLNNKERNFIFIVPTKALTELYRQNKQLLRLTKIALAYLVVMMKQGEAIPNDGQCYACANLLENIRTRVRRIDDGRILIDNTLYAKVEPGTNGKVYKMIEPAASSSSSSPSVPTITDITDEEEKKEALIQAVADEVETRIEDEIKAEEEAEDVTEAEVDGETTTEEEGEDAAAAATTVAPTTTTTTTTTTTNSGTTAEEPKVIATLPEPDADSLAIVPYEEEKPATTTTSLTAKTLAGVYNTTANFKNRKIEQLARKMLNADYSGAKHMSDYIDHQQSDGVSSQIFLKTFSYDDLYQKYLTTNTSLTGNELLTPVDTFAISSTKNLNYALDKSLKMKEFVVDAKTTPITKSQLINHFCVLALKKSDKATSTNKNDYVVASFTLPESTTSHTDTYMSADESLLLKFKENILQSIVLNTNGASLVHVSLSEPSKASSLIAPDANVTQSISVVVPLASNKSTSAQLYGKELNYSQFLGALEKVSRAGFFDRAKAAIAQLTGGSNQKPMMLRRLSVEQRKEYAKKINEYKTLVGESTRSVSLGIGRGLRDVDSQLRKHTLDRVVFRRTGSNKNKWLAMYKARDIANLISFVAMADPSKPSERPTFMINLINPITRKIEFFKFQLSVTEVPVDDQVEYNAKSGDGLIEFLIRLGKDRKLSEIVLFYDLVKNEEQAVKSFEKSIATFFASEAFELERLGLAIPASYTKLRLAKYISHSEFPREKLDKREKVAFFTALQKETNAYVASQQLDSLLLSKAPDTTVTSEKSAIIESSGYKAPRTDETKVFHSLLLKGFANDINNSSNNTTTRAKNVLSAVVKQYSALSKSDNLNDVKFALYMNRFSQIVSFFKLSFENAK